MASLGTNRAQFVLKVAKFDVEKTDIMFVEWWSFNVYECLLNVQMVFDEHSFQCLLNVNLMFSSMLVE